MREIIYPAAFHGESYEELYKKLDRHEEIRDNVFHDENMVIDSVGPNSMNEDYKLVYRKIGDLLMRYSDMTTSSLYDIRSDLDRDLVNCSPMVRLLVEFAMHLAPYAVEDLEQRAVEEYQNELL